MKEKYLLSYKRKILLLVPVFFVCLTAFSQNKSRDSLEQKLTENPNAQEKLEILSQLIRTNFYDDPQKSLSYTQHALEIARQMKDPEEEARMLSTLGVVHYVMFDLATSRQYYDSALVIQEEIQDQKGISTTLHNIGLNFYARGDYSQAIDYYLQSLVIEEKLGNEEGLVESYNNIALVWTDLKNYDKAEAYFKKAWKQVQAFRDEELIMQIALNLAYNYQQQEQFEVSLQYTDTTLKYAQKLGVRVGIAKAKDNRAETFLRQKKYQKALSEIREAQKIFQALENQQAYEVAIISEAKIYLALKNFKRVRDLINPILANQQKSGNKETLQNVYEYLYLANKALGNMNQALEAQELFVIYKDSLLNEQTSKQIAELQTRYETEKKEQEIQNLNQRAKIQSLELDKKNLLIQSYNLNLIILTALVMALLLGGAVLYLIYRQKQLSLQQKTQAAEQKLLRAQMNPHFIFNALTAIQNYIRHADMQAAEGYLVKFAKLMRQILENSRYEYISLDQEMNMLENYLILQNIRQKQPFEFSIIVDEEIDTESMAIPPMFAQPFVENAIEHGIAHLEKPGKITIKFSLENPYIILEVLDNGIGIQNSTKIKQIKSNSPESLATQITQERIAIFKQAIKKNIDFEIRNLREGTQVIFHLPYQYV